MREILFRGKCVFDNEWVEGFYYQAKLCRYDKELCHYITIPHPETDGRPSDHTIVRPETVGQFTGLTDKNGKKIFEGDIVQGKDRLEKHLEVFGYIDHQNGSFVITGDFMTHYRWLDYEVEVIGNIHDNPELLGGTDNERKTD